MKAVTKEQIMTDNQQPLEHLKSGKIQPVQSLNDLPEQAKNVAQEQVNSEQNEVKQPEEKKWGLNIRYGLEDCKLKVNVEQDIPDLIEQTVTETPTKLDDPIKKFIPTLRAWLCEVKKIRSLKL